MQQHAYTVTALTNTIKNLLEGQKTFQGFVLKGEISNFVRHRTGHLYFALKDENAQIKAIMFSSHANSLAFSPKDGDKVTITGSISLYAPQGSYSVQVSKMQLDGAGELYLKYLELKEKLKTLGWFDKPSKAIPSYPKTIGVITSPTGAVIQDITNTVNRRYRLANILLYPALVQGTTAAKSISDQINKANEDGTADVLIVGRGGGSMEDLWCFNELLTISAIYNSKIPVITAIGHETDNTLSDLVSDLRAPTPTAAAELATPDSMELSNKINEQVANLEFRFKNFINKHQNTLLHLSERLEISSPNNKLELYKNRINNQELLLNNYYKQLLKNKTNLLNSETIKLNSLSPKSKLTQNMKDLNNLKVNLNRNYKYILDTSNNKYDVLIKSLHSNYENSIINKQIKYNHILEILKKVNPLSIMQRGFTVTKDDNDNILTSISNIEVDKIINVDFYDGSLKAKVLEKKEK